MHSFLQQVVSDLKTQYGSDISQICLIVPTRRAVQFLKEAIVSAYAQTLWAPPMYSIQDFVRSSFGWQFPDTLPLVFELYQVYTQRMRESQPDWHEPFERFYPWGEMLIKDFDEIDKYCVDAQQLFRNVRDLKEIEAFFNLPEEEEYRAAIARFWYTIRGRGEGPTETQERFLKIWQALYDVYTNYREALATKHLAYDGMAYRYLVEQLEQGHNPFSYPQIIFIGFNALSKAEERIIAYLLENEQARIYWDVDRSYFTPPGESKIKGGHLAGEEAGKFIQTYHKKWSKWNSYLIVHNMQEAPKQIYHTGVPLQVGQAQYLGNLLAESDQNPEDFRKTAVVLADENLLFPVLYALPAQIDRLNITMGFQLRQTHIFSLLMAIMRMMRNLKKDELGQVLFSHKEVREILNNPYLKARNPGLSEAIQQEIRKQNLVLVAQKRLLDADLSPLLAHIFQPPVFEDGPLANVAPLLSYCETVFHTLLDAAQEAERALESEYIFQFYTQFNHLREILSEYPLPLSLRGFVNLFRELMQKVRIPFEGEPLIGLQLMGFLETRVLDFEKIYILGANEGNLPDTSSGNSFIPYSLRKGFGLPTFEEKDAIYAYHFYRLIQRATEVHLIYNTVVHDSGGAGEVSRFIRQIRHFFPSDHPSLKVSERLISTAAKRSLSAEIRIGMNTEIQKKLNHRYSQPSSRSYFSATALNTYLSCPLRYYFRYIADISEPAEVEETMEANTFGSVLHHTMEFIYEPLVQKNLRPEEIKDLKKNLPKSLAEALKKNHLGSPGQLQGTNYLLYGVIEKLCRKILQHDASSESFVIQSLEDDQGYLTRFDTGTHAVRINGTFDRVDLLRDSATTRILDYKTGKVNLGKAETPVSELFEDNAFKEAFQGYLYAWLYLRKHPDAKVQVGYYTARNLNQGIVYLRDGVPLHTEDLHLFEQGLSELINRIFEEDFQQTEDERKCTVCPYKSICNRGG